MKLTAISCTPIRRRVRGTVRHRVFIWPVCRSALVEWWGRPAAWEHLPSRGTAAVCARHSPPPFDWRTGWIKQLVPADVAAAWAAVRCGGWRAGARRGKLRGTFASCVISIIHAGATIVLASDEARPHAEHPSRCGTVPAHPTVHFVPLLAVGFVAGRAMWAGKYN